MELQILVCIHVYTDGYLFLRHGRQFKEKQNIKTSISLLIKRTAVGKRHEIKNRFKELDQRLLEKRLDTPS